MTSTTAIGATPYERFKAARDVLLQDREDYSRACGRFNWPDLQEFNWALDWFDVIAQGERRDQTALWVMHENGEEAKLSFAELSHRSAQVANYFRTLGVRRGDRLMLMLGNVPPLWESILAAMKLGAVVVPTSTLVTTDDISDRILRGNVRHIISTAELAHKFDHVTAINRISVGEPYQGGATLMRLTTIPPTLNRTAKPQLPIPCSSTSPPGQPVNPRSFCTPMRAILRGTFQPCTGWGLNPEMFTAIFPLPDGPNTLGAVFSRLGMPRPRYSRLIRRALTLQLC